MIDPFDIFRTLGDHGGDGDGGDDSEVDTGHLGDVDDYEDIKIDGEEEDPDFDLNDNQE